jgi:catechol 2,3-dioxygenase-like lactoylglutathione lyase family enzyme
MKMKYLHTMIRVTDPEASLRFFDLLGLRQVRRMDNEPAASPSTSSPRRAMRMRRSSSPTIGITTAGTTAAAISATSPTGWRISTRPASG